LDSGNKSDNLNALLDGWKQRETDISVYEKVNNMILKDKKDPTVLAYLQANKPSLQDLITRNYFAAQALPTSPTTPSLPKDKETDVVVTSPEKTIVSDTKITAPANVEKIEDANAVTVIDTPATKKPTTETTTPVVVDTPVKVETPVVVTSPEKTLTDADKILKRNAEGVNVLQKHNLALIADKTDLPYLDKTTSHMDIR
jgi:hypothetical protein